MFKIFMTVCNRLEVTKHAIKAIEKHSTIPYQLYIYDNHTNYRLDDHFDYYKQLFKTGKATQITFNTRASTFNAFSKASACNQFGLTHEIDPQRDTYDFLLILDNDIIVTPDYDKYLKNAWMDVKKHKITNVKIISQNPGGIVNKKPIAVKIANQGAVVGKAGGSGFWCVQNNFFRDVGFLDLKLLVGLNKRHDINYWKRLDRASQGKPYILGLNRKLCVHCGGISGSVCNILTRNRNSKNVNDLIKFKTEDELIGKMSFEEFYTHVIKNVQCTNNW